MPVTLIDSEHFAHLLASDTPFIDVRAEIEFAKGSIPNAVNLPILNNHERHNVGTAYKQRGQASAIELGHQLVGGRLREQRVAQWCEFAQRNPGVHVFCWRGGMRSNLAGQWMAEAGTPVPVIEGGFKALRHFLMHVTEQAAGKPLMRLGGRTGSDKTRLIAELANSVDLEHHANHRGSSFGRRATEVPSQIEFEHSLALDFLKQQQQSWFVLEDESARIGAVGIPLPLQRAMVASPLVILERTMEERVEVTRRVYVEELLEEFVQLGIDNPRQAFAQHLQSALARIKNRLGGERYMRIERLLTDALSADDVQPKAHNRWIEPLLTEYYDPLYDYQLDKNTQPVLFSGGYEEVREWLNEQSL